MHRIVSASMIVLGLAASASAQSGSPISVIIPISHKVHVSSGFREIPDGSFVFQVTLQTDGSPIADSVCGSSNPNVTWVAQNPAPATTIWATSAAYSESEIGTVGGGILYTSDVQPPTASTWDTVNAFWGDVYDDSGEYSGGPYYDAAVGVWGIDQALAPVLPAGTTTGYDIPSLTVLTSSHDGDLWFTSDSSEVAMYWLDPTLNMWVKIDQPTRFASNGSGYLAGQFQIHATLAFTGQTTVRVHYRAVDSVNPSSEDTIDTLDVIQLDDSNNM